MMTEQQFTSLIKEAPYLLDKAMFPITRSEAVDVFADNPVSLDEFVVGVKARLPQSAWKEYDDAFARIKQSEVAPFIQPEGERRQNSKKKTLFTLRSRRSRLAVASLIVISVLSYFTFVPAGKSLAMEWIGYIGQLFGNRLEISINDKPDEIDINAQEYTLAYRAFDELPELSIEPFVIHADGINVQHIEYDVTPTRKLLYTTYADEKGLEIYVSQYWDIVGDIGFVSNNDAYSIIQYNNESVYVNEDAIDGKISANIVRKNSIINIAVQNMKQIDRILREEE